MSLKNLKARQTRPSPQSGEGKRCDPCDMGGIQSQQCLRGPENGDAEKTKLV
jgi:hypothetical protein